MTDLERARSELLDIVACAYQGIWTQPLIARVTEILAAARREGAEAEREAAYWRGLEAGKCAALVDRQIGKAEGAEEMRERAAQWHHQQAAAWVDQASSATRAGLKADAAFYMNYAIIHRQGAFAMTALPLTPEEPPRQPHVLVTVALPADPEIPATLGARGRGLGRLRKIFFGGSRE